MPATPNKTLILNGSPRKNGDTASLINVLTDSLKGEYFIVGCCSKGITPCADCRRCRTAPGCAIGDGMRDVYRYLETCDNVVIASPVWFSELTGPLLSVASRFQTYWCARYFRHEDPGLKPKKGGVILTGGGDGDPARAFDTAKILLHQVNAAEIFPLVCSHHTNTLPAARDENAVRAVRRLAGYLNGTGSIDKDPDDNGGEP